VPPEAVHPVGKALDVPKSVLYSVVCAVVTLANVVIPKAIIRFLKTNNRFFFMVLGLKFIIIFLFGVK
jgi:hypothetical protein